MKNIVSDHTGWLWIVCILLGLCLQCPAQAYFSFGARAAGMGNAYVSVVEDASAAYWNPSSLALIEGWSVTMDFGGEYFTADNIQQVVESLYDMDPREWDDPSFTDDRDRLIDLMDKLEDSSWTHRGGERFGLSIAHKNSAFSIIGYDLYYIQPEVDLQNLDLNPEGEMYIGNNTTALKFSGFHVQEYGLSFSWLSPNRAMTLGLTGKYVDFDGYDWTGILWDEPSMDPEDLLDRVETGSSYSQSDWGIDAGITVFMGRNRFSVVGHNLNTLEVDTDSDTTLEIKPDYRLGYAFFPTDRFTFGIDYTISSSRDPRGNKLDGKDISIGFEGKFGPGKQFILRGGSIIDSGGDAPIIFTGGAAIEFEHAALDFGYARDQDGDSQGIWGGLRVFF
jgi:F plasmid transfer operon, TraF, protein